MRRHHAFIDDCNPFVDIDCGIPLDVKHGRYQLLNGTTSYGSIVKYTCAENFALEGNATRNCTEYAAWSGTEPTCKREYTRTRLKLQVLSRTKLFSAIMRHLCGSN